MRQTGVLICCLLGLYIFIDVLIVQVWVLVVYLEVAVLIECNGILLCCVWAGCSVGRVY